MQKTMPCPGTDNKLQAMKNVTAMILAGGRGKRMGALCDTKPKPALPFGGRNCVIDFTLQNCINSGIRNIVALVDYKRDEMTGCLREWCFINQLSENIFIREPGTGSYRGTADAVFQNLNIVHESGAEAVIILAADHIYSMDYHEMFDFHNRVGADITVGVIPVPLERASRFGIVSMDGNGKIVSFQEKPDKPASNLASMGIYIFNTDVLTRHLVKDALDPGSSHDFGYSVLPEVIKNESVFAYKFNDYWQDIGTPEAYHRAHMDILSGKISLSHENTLPEDSEFDNLLSPVQMTGGKISNSIIDKSCVVNGRVENSVLSPGVFVSENAVVKNAVIMAGTIVGYGSTVYNCIIDEEVEIGDYAHVGAVSSFSEGSKKIRVVEKGTRIPGHPNIKNSLQDKRNPAFRLDLDRPVSPDNFDDEDLVIIVKG